MSTHIPQWMRRAVVERAEHCCEYCLTPESVALASHEVDHVIAQKHGGATALDNLALSCKPCNLRKGTDIASVDPVTGAIVPLFNPRTGAFRAHFEACGAEIQPLTPAGRATALLLRLNAPERLAERAALLEAGALVRP